MSEHHISTEEQLRAITGEPVHELVLVKSADRITEPMRRYLELSPFCCLATHGADGASDVSPRGDAPGFARVINDRTLLIPDRPGNKRLDSIVNIINQPRLALLFMIPGTLDTLRINGRGVITTDPDLLSQCEAQGKQPQLGILVTVEEALGHCSKALRRSRLWQDDYRAEAVPTLAELMSGHLGLDEPTREFLEAAIDDDARNNMY